MDLGSTDCKKKINNNNDDDDDDDEYFKLWPVK